MFDFFVLFCFKFPPGGKGMPARHGEREETLQSPGECTDSSSTLCKPHCTNPGVAAEIAFHPPCPPTVARVNSHSVQYEVAWL